jgi:hypothetical protein
MYFVLAARRLRALLGDERVRVGVFRCGVPRGQPGFCEKELNMPEYLPRTFRTRAPLLQRALLLGEPLLA